MVRRHQDCAVPNLGVREFFIVFATNVLFRRLIPRLKLRHATVIWGEIFERKVVHVCDKKEDFGHIINGHIIFQQRQICPCPHYEGIWEGELKAAIIPKLNAR